MLANPCGATLGGGFALTTSEVAFSGVSACSGMSAEDGEGPSGAELLGLAGFLALAVLIPLVAGLAIDASAHTGPVGMLVGLGAGIAAAVAGLWVRLKRYL